MRFVASTAVALVLAAAAAHAQEYPGAILPTPEADTTLQRQLEQTAQMPSGAGEQLAMAPPGGGYRKVSEIAQLPDFLPGLGTLYVQPETIPQGGPFLAYDRQGQLVSTVYMVTMKDIESRKQVEELSAGPLKVDHVDMYYNAGHPGVPEPHYHVVLWHVPESVAASLK